MRRALKLYCVLRQDWDGNPNITKPSRKHWKHLACQGDEEKKDHGGHFQVLKDNLTDCVTGGGRVGIQTWPLGIKAGPIDLGKKI